MSQQINPKRLAEMIEVGKGLIQKSPGTTFKIRNAIDELDRLTPAKGFTCFGTGAVQKNAADGIAHAARQLLDGIMECDA